MKKDNHVTITIPLDDSFEQKVKFLEKCAIQTPEYEANELTDFIILREQPLFKVEEGKYRIVSEVFLIEKIFKNLYFRFDAINRNLSGPNRINELHSFIALEFSEKELFYELMKLSFSNQETHFSGAQLAQMDITGAPDYLFKEDGNIYLFENKDILLKAEIKNSYDFERIKNELIKKLYIDPSNDKPKAVIQLTKSIERILNNEYAGITRGEEPLKFIYPILVLHDRVFSVEGLNFFVNKWFQLELIKLKERGIEVSKVRPITVINIDTFALFHEQIKNCPMGFSAYLESYIDFADLDCKRGEMDVEERVERLATFDYFLPQQFEALIRTPKILIEKGFEYLG